MGDHRMGVNAPKRPDKAGLADGRGRSPTNSGAILARSAAFLASGLLGGRGAADHLYAEAALARRALTLLTRGPLA